MIKSMTVAAVLALSACDAGSYHLPAHRDADAATGSLLPGTDTGVDANGSLSNPSIGSNKNAGAPGRGS